MTRKTHETRIGKFVRALFGRPTLATRADDAAVQQALDGLTDEVAIQRASIRKWLDETREKRKNGRQEPPHAHA